MSEENLKSTNPKDLIGSDKLPLHLFPFTAVVYGTLALLDGALKYGRANWRVAGVRASIYYDACLRHMTKWFEGENIDKDSGLPHLAHALACITILIDATETDKLKDDRMVKGGYLELLKRIAPDVARLKEFHKGKNPKHWTIEDTQTKENNLPSFIIDGVCMLGTEGYEKVICNLGRACDACPYNKGIKNEKETTE